MNTNMNKLLIAVAFLLVAFTSCKKNTSPTVVLDEMVDTSAIVTQRGMNNAAKCIRFNSFLSCNNKSAM
ncbi:MAG: hypothetical protein ABIS01_14225 [Ferruginibacter sp.]